MKLTQFLPFLGLVLVHQFSLAQGPPIIADKPIMLGSGNKVIRTLTEIRHTTRGRFINTPLIVNYLPTANTLVGVHINYLNSLFEFSSGLGNDRNLGDIFLLGKYQFLRKDQTGKTFRMAAKTVQTLPTGKKLDIDMISMGTYQSYVGLIAGYESIKYGINQEVGYALMPESSKDELRYRVSFGLPLLTPTYPLRQLSLYFEYQTSWFTERGDHMLLYSQGLQYAHGRMTFEVAYQWPLSQEVDESEKRDYSLFLSTRIILF
ncbi:MAG: hypothetical protein AAF824_09795 [Bacteroidota bacterium]